MNHLEERRPLAVAQHDLAGARDFRRRTGRPGRCAHRPSHRAQRGRGDRLETRHRLQHRRRENCADAGGLGLAARLGRERGIEVVDVPRHPRGEDGQHLLPLHPPQQFRQRVGIVGGNQRSLAGARHRHVQREVHPGHERAPVRSFDVNDSHLGIDRAHRTDHLRIAPARIRVDGAVAEQKATVECQIVLPGAAREHPGGLQVDLGQADTLGNHSRQLLDVALAQLARLAADRLKKQRMCLRARMAVRGRDNEMFGPDSRPLGDQPPGLLQNRPMDADQIAGHPRGAKAVLLKHDGFCVEIGRDARGDLDAVGIPHHAADGRRDAHFGAADAQLLRGAGPQLRRCGRGRGHRSGEGEEQEGEFFHERGESCLRVHVQFHESHGVLR